MKEMNAFDFSLKSIILSRPASTLIDMGEISVIDVFNLPKSENESHFLISINSNKTIGSLNLLYEWENATKIMIEEHIMTHQGLAEIIEFRDGKNLNSVISTHCEYGSEIGPGKGRYHVHIYLKLIHKSNIRIDRNKLKKIVVMHWGRFGVTNPWIYIKALYSTIHVRNYIGKTLEEFLYKN